MTRPPPPRQRARPAMCSPGTIDWPSDQPRHDRDATPAGPPARPPREVLARDHRLDGGGLWLASTAWMIVIVGSVAALCSITAFVPQAWRIVKTRKTEDLSILMWTLQVIAFVAWIIYGAMLAAWPIVVPNAVCVVLSGFILMMSILPRHMRHAVADRIDPDAPPDARST